MWRPAVQTSQTSFLTAALSAGTWTVEVRAFNAQGIESAPRTAVMLVPTDDRAVSFSAGGRRLVSASDQSSTVTTTAVTGSRAVVRFTGSSFVIVGRVGPQYGRMSVVVDGRAYTVDERTWNSAPATGTHYRVVVFSRTLTAGAHTVVITCLGTAGRPTINLDAVAWRS